MPPRQRKAQSASASTQRVAEQNAEPLLAKDSSLADKTEVKEVVPRSAPAKEVAFIEVQLERVPFVGQYVGPLLFNRYTLPVMKKVDPIVEAGVQRAAPYMEGVATRVRQAPVVIQTVPGQVCQLVKEAPGHASQSIKAMPGHVYQTIAQAAQKIRAVPAQVYETTTLTGASIVDRTKAAPAKISQIVSEVSGKVSENIKATRTKISESGPKAFANLKAAPTKIYQRCNNFAGQVLENIRAAADGAYKTTKSSASRMMGSIKAAPSKVYQKATSIAQSIRATPGKVYHRVVGVASLAAESTANAAQSYVHRGVKIVAPRAELVAKSQHVQSVYHHWFVQGGIEKASPYVSKAGKQPTIEKISNQVIAWALPAM